MILFQFSLFALSTFSFLSCRFHFFPVDLFESYKQIMLKFFFSFAFFTVHNMDIILDWMEYFPYMFLSKRWRS